MNVEKVELYVVNDANIYVVDENGGNRLLWDLSDDTMGIGFGFRGESFDKFGYVDMKFDRVEVFCRKFDAMERWVEL